MEETNKVVVVFLKKKKKKERERKLCAKLNTLKLEPIEKQPKCITAEELRKSWHINWKEPYVMVKTEKLASQNAVY